MEGRGNIRITSGDSEVFLYTHWRGSELPEIVKKSLQTDRARSRWHDGQYLTRILFQDLISDDHSESGYGVSSTIGDGEDQILHVNVDLQLITWDTRNNRTDTKTFEEFVDDTGFKSSAIYEMSYSADGTLRLQFTSSDTKYSFLDVPVSVFEALVASKSKGRFVADHIRGQYSENKRTN